MVVATIDGTVVASRVVAGGTAELIRQVAADTDILVDAVVA